MTNYLDTSALAKLVVHEQETESLRSWLRARKAQPVVVSVVGVIELRRVAARYGQEASAAAGRLLARIDVLELTTAVVGLAAALPAPTIRTLDAIHVASAAQLSDLEALVTYDLRIADAARGYGFMVESP